MGSNPAEYNNFVLLFLSWARVLRDTPDCLKSKVIHASKADFVLLPNKATLLLYERTLNEGKKHQKSLFIKLSVIA